MSQPSISVVLPAFNEEANLWSTVNDAIAALDRIGASFEIIIVDDGSRDGTAEVCRKLRALHRSIMLIRHPSNRGYGAALRSGFGAARHELVFFTDADGQFRFDELPLFLSCIESVNAVIGYRVDRRDPWHRKVISRVGNWFARTFLAIRARDINCAYKVLKRESLRKLPLRCEGVMISTELLALAGRAGWKLCELPVSHYPRHLGKQTGARPLVMWRVILEFWQTFRTLNVEAASDRH